MARLVGGVGGDEHHGLHPSRPADRLCRSGEARWSALGSLRPAQTAAAEPKHTPHSHTQPQRAGKAHTDSRLCLVARSHFRHCTRQRNVWLHPVPARQKSTPDIGSAERLPLLVERRDERVLIYAGRQASSQRKRAGVVSRVKQAASIISWRLTPPLTRPRLSWLNQQR
ncbi:Hypothetical predicted protein [Cloeon dipterum]|uniref:Uncharacterized protein n=1 Tax=Cloeon dipterum TaxID=197152 RepID=A0A8S1D4M7_9INSE|nr:Hypothetical predicted protein [Cloeon dipterum]